jgi:hypothetical protein
LYLKHTGFELKHQFLWAHVKSVLEIIPWLSPSTSFPIHHSSCHLTIYSLSYWQHYKETINKELKETMYLQICTKDAMVIINWNSYFICKHHYSLMKITSHSFLHLLTKSLLHDVADYLLHGSPVNNLWLSMNFWWYNLNLFTVYCPKHLKHICHWFCKLQEKCHIRTLLESTA